MRKVVLYIAMSLDGYVADQNGGVGWLDKYESQSSSYDDFIKTIDTVIMGKRTYDQITILSPDQWVYDGLTSYVITHNDAVSNDKIMFVPSDPKVLVSHLKDQAGKNIWICGGADIINQLSGFIDEYRITVIPTILGDGIPLFGAAGHKTDLKLIKTKKYNDLIELTYQK